MYRKFRNVPIFKDFPLICPYFLGFRVGKYELHVKVWTLSLYRSRAPWKPHFIALQTAFLEF